MALLTHDYNPLGTASLFVNALELGQRRQQQELSLLAQAARAVADDKRMKEQFDRKLAFEAARDAEDRRRFELEQLPFTLPTLPGATPATALTGGVAPTGAAPGAQYSVPTVEDSATPAPTLSEGSGAVATVPDINADTGASPGFDLDMLDVLNPAAAAPSRPASVSGAIEGPLPTGAGVATGSEALIPESPATRVTKYLGDLSKLNTPGKPAVVRTKDVRAALPGLLSSAFAADSRERIAATKASGGSSVESIEQATQGMDFIPERNTYRRKDGSEYYVSRSASGKIAMKPFQPNTTAARIMVGSDGQPYPFDRDGEPLKQIPEGVTFTKKITSRVPGAGTFLIDPVTEQATLLIPEKTKIPPKLQTDYVRAVTEVEKATDELEGAKRLLAEKGQKGFFSWFGASPDLVNKAEKRLNEATARRDAIRSTYPELGTGSNADSSTTAPQQQAKAPETPKLNANEKAQSIASAKAALTRNPGAKDAIRQRMLAGGFTEAELQSAGL